MPDRRFLTENSDSLQVLTGLVSLAVTLLPALPGWWLRRKQVTYRVHLDTPVGINPAEGTSMIDVQLHNRKNVVEKPSFALVRIVNTGNSASGAARSGPTPVVGSSATRPSAAGRASARCGCPARRWWWSPRPRPR
ncbi:hypothetical protein [Actinosynnema pretiosum]|uniref:Uncharacterized protein n=1 Tax=Actinosynnema pretiosum TaxID=42197 RepID=A0A290Z8E3_9PSEU|nr:hypothetical protein [Actinosynnema pretiosum]ATE55297.1 hypothetical protein CNX65_20080 [Actinosynnema pretiosum]